MSDLLDSRSGQSPLPFERPVEGPGAEIVLGPEERELLAQVEPALRRGVEMLRWWEETNRRDDFHHHFELGRTFNEPEVGFGFFDRTRVGDVLMPVMGNFQSMFFDRPKSTRSGERAAVEWIHRQAREFVLGYFMRVSDFQQPQGYIHTWTPPMSFLFRPLSWCPDGRVQLGGFGFQQLYYKRRDDGRIGMFAPEEQFAIVDLRELVSRYEWIVVRVRIFDFQFSFRPFGSSFPGLVVPLEESSYLALSRELIVDEERPEPGVLGRYGVGYSFLKNPRPGLLGYGPGEFDAAVERIVFEVADDGVIRVPMLFVANQPDRIVNLELDPLRLGARLTDLATLGLASRFFGGFQEALSASAPRGRVDPVDAYIRFADFISGGLSSESLCIHREQLYKDFLVKHYEQHYQTIAGALSIWRQVADWSDPERLPTWVLTGIDR
jgi:hypothetical protein